MNNTSLIASYVIGGKYETHVSRERTRGAQGKKERQERAL
jgi:hypothetical protein